MPPDDRGRVRPRKPPATTPTTTTTPPPLITNPPVVVPPVVTVPTPVVPNPVPAAVDPMIAIVGGAAFTDDYGFKAPTNLGYYDYFVGHGGTANQHTGIDLVVPFGTKMYTPRAGVVDCVGERGNPRWGQGCGAYNDTGDAGPSGARRGVGNITIMLDNGVKLTLGHSRTATVKVGDRVTAGQLVGTSGGMNGAHIHVETSVERNGTYWIVEPRQAIGTVPVTAPGPIPRALPTGTVKTKTPKNEPYGHPWKRGTDLLPKIEAECAKYPGVNPLVILAMGCVETGWQQFWPDGSLVVSGNDGHGDGAAIGAWQIKRMWQKVRPGSDMNTLNGNIELAVALFAAFLAEVKTWQRVIIERWHPGTDPRSKMTPDRYVSTVSALVTEFSAAAGPMEPVFPWPVQWVEVPGFPGKKMPLPADVQFIVKLTPVGNNRPGRKMTATGMTQHETGNRGVGAGAVMHSNWQDGGTEGHPDGYVAVHVYGDDKFIIVKIPLNEVGIHSGDWRNNSHPAYELAVNADRNAALAERNAIAFDAGFLGWILETTAKESLYPHRPSGCPAIINGRNGWSAFETDVQRIISGGAGNGPTVPLPTYAEPDPVPKEWDGLDWIQPSTGTRFIALRRVFVVSNPAGTKARKYATKDGAEVRAPLKQGEAFEAYYVVASDGGMWFVSRFGTRIFAADCEPKLTTFAGVAVAADAFWTVAGDLAQDDADVKFRDRLDALAIEVDQFRVLDADPYAGLSGLVPADADMAPVGKREFMGVDYDVEK